MHLDQLRPSSHKQAHPGLHWAPVNRERERERERERAGEKLGKGSPCAALAYLLTPTHVAPLSYLLPIQTSKYLLYRHLISTKDRTATLPRPAVDSFSTLPVQLLSQASKGTTVGSSLSAVRHGKLQSLPDLSPLPRRACSGDLKQHRNPFLPEHVDLPTYGQLIGDAVIYECPTAALGSETTPPVPRTIPIVTVVLLPCQSLGRFGHTPTLPRAHSTRYEPLRRSSRTGSCSPSHDCTRRFYRMHDDVSGRVGRAPLWRNFMHILAAFQNLCLPEHLEDSQHQASAGAAAF
ncbi:predicted protein [Plenodomus lingam JN3]|uniref:Predicted protein n=1 Tax=Leptosphaeria maculans (strain JN3 / isolate v23.1.3 / race Av1-4-5-6-7-8) TaxID=985895 RepID=E5ACF6_LEPMJ|nr:predicted protein [Plenodomus lingam JN3]CBY02158.1 predicted protein [Plenodomus lingam JN3]